MKHIRSVRPLWALVVGLIGLSMLVSACGGSAAADTKPNMPGKPVIINGQQYCGYVAVPHECDLLNVDLGVNIPRDHYYQFPQGNVASSDPNHDLLVGLIEYYMMYHWFFADSYYYNHYVPNTNRAQTAYTNRTTVITRTYHTQFKNFENKGTWKSPSGKPVKPSQVKSQYTVRNNGGSGGTKNCSLGRLDSSLNGDAITLASDSKPVVLARGSHSTSHSSSHSGSKSKTGSGSKPNTGGNKGSGSKVGC